MSLQDAEENYGKWTNDILTRFRTYATRHSQPWFYAAVTERQTRGHPHSHFITTFKPPDIRKGKRLRRKKGAGNNTTQELQDCLLSDYIERACVECGFGNQYDISRVRSAQAASRYVAKYLFKETNFRTIWPKGWRRIRYSQSWPKLPEIKTEAFALITREDWHKLDKMALIVQPDNEFTWQECLYRLRGSDVIIMQNETQRQ